MLCSTSMMEGTGSLEQQLATLRQRAVEVRARRADLRRLEELGTPQYYSTPNRSDPILGRL